ncbi:MAG: hypothetical protein LBS01_04745 [Prevotellaceae bacterium]|jgi:hypothetical protein|nr:hypothetical protein [Prevotellaceae bacterium]
MSKITDVKPISLGQWSAVYSGRDGNYRVNVSFDGKFFYNAQSTCDCIFKPCRHTDAVIKTIRRRLFFKRLFFGQTVTEQETKRTKVIN